MVAEFELNGNWESANVLLQAVKRRLEALPGVRAVVADPHSYYMYTLGGAVGSDHSSSKPLEVRALGIDAGYFKALDVPVMHGREFRAGDQTNVVAPIIIASDLADELFPGVNPVGRRLYRLRGEKRTGEVEVVGVVDAAIVGRSDAQQRKRIFSADAVDVERSLLIRTHGPSEPLIPALRAAIQSEARMLPIRSMLTLAQVERNQRSAMLKAASVAAGAGALVLLLASIGLYAVVALSVSQRRREIGIRIAIGGRPLKVASVYFGRGVRLGLTGLVLGLPIGVAGLRFLAMEVELPRANFPLVALIVGMVVIGVACIASWLPARHAANVDPVIALRSN